MPFVETFLFEDDAKKFEKISGIITENLHKIFKTNKSTITIYNTVIEQKNFYHNSILENNEKRIFIKIFCLKRSKTLKEKLALKIISCLQEIIKVKRPDNIAVYFFDKVQTDVHHGKIK
jgi:phenylpyruvate tautomerase PptA (4-oxalocrotonate tautomerase family)